MANKRAALAIAILAVASTAMAKDGAPSRLFPDHEEDTGVLRLAQAVHVEAREEIAASGPHYQFLLATGIREADAGDGRLSVVRVYCCGNRIEEDQSLWAYVPPAITVHVGDFVELRMGRVPKGSDPGVVNTVTALRQKTGDEGSGPCRWAPDNPSLSMRILYCDGIEEQGWVERKGERKMWYLPAGVTAATPVSVATPAPAATEAAPPASESAAEACYLVNVRPTLQDVASTAAKKSAIPLDLRFAGEPAADACQYRIDLEFSSRVDRSSQRRNQGGAVSGGPATLLLGAITPWSCPTTHTLTAAVTDRNGASVANASADMLQKRVGTMLVCTDVEEPKDSVVSELVGKVLADIAARAALGFALAGGAAAQTPEALERPKAEPAQPQQQGGEARLRELAGPMVDMPGGEFRMGDSVGGGEADEQPVHTVRVKPFRLGQHEVTVGQFRAFVAATGYQTEAERNVGAPGCAVLLDVSRGTGGFRAGTTWSAPGFEQSSAHPVTCVSWNDAQAYLEWLRAETGLKLRLPSEAEWEYAARAGAGTRYPWGDDANAGCAHANGADQTGGIFRTKMDCRDGHFWPAPVGSYRANGFGLHDLIGNVWEWTADCWHESYAGAPADGSAWTSGDCSLRMVRGGSWTDGPRLLRVSARNWLVTWARGGYHGFRLAQDP